MNRYLLLFCAVLGALSLRAQTTFTQSFESATAPDSFRNFSLTTRGKFNGIGTGASIVANGSNKLQLQRSGASAAGYFVRRYLGYNYLEAPAYGALISVNNAPVNKPKTASRLGIIHQRDAIIISDPSSWSSLMYDLGYKIALNVNWDRTNNGPVPYPDSARFRDSLTLMLNSTHIQPAVLVIENEERNTNYHIGWTNDYLMQLMAAVRVAHNFGFRVTNGGLTAAALRYATWKYLSDLSIAGHTQARADAFHALTLANTNYGQASLQLSGRFVDTLVHAYHDIDIDYINFHWYGGDGTLGSQTPVLDEVINYIQEVSGKQAMTNEIGQYNALGATVDSLLDETRARNLPFVLWYDSDGTSAAAPAVALNDATGNLNANGIVFRDSLAAHGQAYLPARVLSVGFRLRALAVSAPNTSGNELSIGNGFSVDENAPATDSVHAALSVLLTSGGFRLRETGGGAVFPATEFTDEQELKWYLNTTANNRYYTAPDGSSDLLAPRSFDLWVRPSAGGAWTRAFNDVASLNPSVLPADLKFRFGSGAGTLQFDDINVSDETATTSLSPLTALDAPVLPGSDRSLRLAPDATGITVWLDAERTGTGSLLLFDLTGKCVGERKVLLQPGANEIHLPVPAPAGVYLLQAAWGGKTKARKFFR